MLDKYDDFGVSRRAMIRGCGALILCSVAVGLPARAEAAGPSFTSGRLGIVARGERARQGRDILLIPGLASSPAIWSSLVSRLAGHRLHLVHINGFAGRAAGANASGALLGPLSGELARYITSEGLRAPVVIGHSMGGTLALMLALRADVRPASVLVVDMLPDASSMVGGTAQGLGYLAGQLNGYLTGTKAGRQILTDMVRETPAGRDSDARVIAQALSELAQTDLTPALGRIACPLTVMPALSGKAETDRAQLRRYRAAYARVPSLFIDGIGPSAHQIMLDQPEKFAAAVHKFLGKLR